MKQYSTFIFESFDFDRDTLEVKLNYSLDDEVHFTETLTLPRDGIFLDGVSEELLNRALFALHIAGGVSYYKTCIPKTIEVRSGQLSKEQAEFWNSVYENGLGEFFYRNELEFEGLINFPITSDDEPDTLYPEETHDRVLVPMGGGKDSIVTTELLKSAGLECVLFRMGSHPLIEQAAEVAKVPLVNIERTLAPELFELNDDGALNGHIPITAYLSCVTVVMALLYGFDYIAFSNESSASEGNVEYKGKEINHQWSKSLEFERMFQRYVHNFITPGIDYFSLLRSMTELQITNLFSIHKQYFECFTSCNANWRILKEKPAERWIAEPKTAFVYALFAAFLGKDDLMTIFGQDFFSDESLLPVYRQLLGIEGFKPFECVGTPEETAAAFALALQKGDLKDAPAMKVFVEEKAPTIENIGSLVEGALSVSDEHLVTSRFLLKLES